MDLMFGILLLLAEIQFVFVHGPDGQEININVAEISSIRQPRENSESHFAKGTNCLVFMTNGKFIATTELCLDIIKQIADHKVK
jgi:hypothetical protein